MKTIRFLLSFIWNFKTPIPRRKYAISVFLPLIVIWAGCSRIDSIKEMVEAMQSHQIVIPYSNMKYICERGIVTSSFNVQSPHFQLVVFSDSTRCSSCTINRLSRWNEFLNLEREGKLQLTFIIHPPKEEIGKVVESYYSSGLEHPILIDTCGIFLEKNPHIPEEPLYHTFLIDSIGKVVLVGNPLENGKIKELFNKIIK